jgi:hypothetical protein
MVTLADAAALVPQKPRAEEEEKGPAFMDMDDLINIMIVPDKEDHEHVQWTWEGIGKAFAKHDDETIRAAITKGALDELDFEAAIARTQRRDSERSSNILKWLASKAVTTLWKYLVKRVWKGIFSICKWIIKKVVKFAVRGLVNWVVRPVLTGILDFVGVNPELWPFVAAAGGVAAVGWLIYDKWFSGTQPSTPEADEDAADEAAIEKAMGLVQQPSASEMAQAAETKPVSAAQQKQQWTEAVRQGQISPAQLTTGAAPPIAAGEAVAAGAPSPSLMALISRGEGTYDSVNLGAAHGYKAATADLRHMTIAEVMQHQQAHDFNAVGRYQIIGPTLASAVKTLKLDTSALFNEATQDMIFTRFLIGIKRRAIGDYITGKSDNLYAAVLAASQEWASVAAPAGAQLFHSTRTSDGTISYYAGTANNKASIKASEMAAVLMQERANYLGSTTVNTAQAKAPEASIPQKTAQAQAQINAGGTTQTVLPDSTGNGDKTILNRGNGKLLAVS